MSMSRPNGDGSQSMAERKSKNVQPSLRLATSAASGQASRVDADPEVVAGADVGADDGVAEARR